MSWRNLMLAACAAAAVTSLAPEQAEARHGQFVGGLLAGGVLGGLAGAALASRPRYVYGPPAPEYVEPAYAPPPPPAYVAPAPAYSPYEECHYRWDGKYVCTWR